MSKKKRRKTLSPMMESVLLLFYICKHFNFPSEEDKFTLIHSGISIDKYNVPNATYNALYRRGYVHKKSWQYALSDKITPDGERRAEQLIKKYNEDIETSLVLHDL